MRVILADGMVSFVFELAEAMAKEMRHEVAQQERTSRKHTIIFENGIV